MRKSDEKKTCRKDETIWRKSMEIPNWTWQGSDRPDHPRMKALLPIEMASPPFPPFRWAWESQGSIYLNCLFLWNFNGFIAEMQVTPGQSRGYINRSTQTTKQLEVKPVNDRWLLFSAIFLDSWTMVGWEGIAPKRPAIGKLVMASFKVCCRWIMEEYVSTQRKSMTILSSSFQPIFGWCEPAVCQLACRWKLLSQKNRRNRSRSLQWDRRTVGIGAADRSFVRH